MAATSIYLCDMKATLFVRRDISAKFSAVRGCSRLHGAGTTQAAVTISAYIFSVQLFILIITNTT